MRSDAIPKKRAHFVDSVHEFWRSKKRIEDFVPEELAGRDIPRGVDAANNAVQADFIAPHEERDRSFGEKKGESASAHLAERRMSARIRVPLGGGYAELDRSVALKGTLASEGDFQRDDELARVVGHVLKQGIHRFDFPGRKHGVVHPVKTHKGSARFIGSPPAFLASPRGLPLANAV